jgi:hypothetical protein
MTAVRDDAEPALCPSAPAQPGALLIGVVQDGTVALLGTPLPVDAAFVETAARHGKPERRFRFSVPCAEAACGHWTGSACGLIGITRGQARDAGLAVAETTLPRCAIRARCRWWRQDGRAACATCAYVVYDPSAPPDPARTPADALAGDA